MAFPTPVFRTSAPRVHAQLPEDVPMTTIPNAVGYAHGGRSLDDPGLACICFGTTSCERLWAADTGERLLEGFVDVRT